MPLKRESETCHLGYRHAPCSISNRETSRDPPKDARCNGVLWPRPRAFTFAPCPSKSSAVAWFPCCDALYGSMEYRLCEVFTFVALLTRNSSRSIFRACNALCNDESPKESRALDLPHGCVVIVVHVRPALDQKFHNAESFKP
jgi:hypothetical protein